MQSSNIFIKKGAIMAYRLYDIAHEINLKKAQEILTSASTQSVKRFQLQKDPLRTIVLREAPLTMAGGEEVFKLKVNKEEKEFKAQVELKIWDYGVISFAYRIDLTENLLWNDLVLIGSILDSDSIIDELSIKKRDELFVQLQECLKYPKIQDVFEDYTTYLVEDLEETSKKKEGDTEVLIPNKVKDPLDLLKKPGVAELLLAEPKRSLSDSTRKSITSSYMQYTKKDMLVLDWNSALVVDLTKEKEYQDYVDIIEFSLAQLLELRIYDQLLDKKLDELYDSMEKKEHEKITDFYSSMSDESSRLYMEFSDFFEKLDNSIKTIGDFYLAKVLKSADKKFGFDELKKNMSRKIDALREMASMCQDKIDSLVDEKRNQLAEHNNKLSHRLELIIIALILVEVIHTFWPFIVNFFKNITNIF